MSIRFIMIGGFLGAGKTTTIGRLARQYMDQGLRVGIVTNDQATDLVDTHFLRAQGFAVGEVAGACFCCNFNELTRAADQLAHAARPDVILAEPVGSCTDLVATVVQPLRRLLSDTFSVAPYGVIVKPSHGRRILAGGGSGFSPKAEYIFRKQLEEADFLIVNRIDELAPEVVEELCSLVATCHPETPVVRVSARTGRGFDGLCEMLDQDGALDLDYDLYAEGEAELGWLNGNVGVVADAPFSLDRLLMDILAELRGALAATGAETAHLKAIGLAEGAYGVANLTSRDALVELSLPSHCQTRAADLVVNARVASDPDTLARHVGAAVEASCRRAGARPTVRQMQSFRPGRPVPTHRYVVAE
jgi:Ni2+-binding GTPase involved in maturation of urease and hydrogenase